MGYVMMAPMPVGKGGKGMPMWGMGGGGKGKGGAAMEPVGPSGQGAGEVRFANPSAAQLALSTLQGSLLKGSQITISVDSTSKDASKVLVGNLGAGTSWTDL